MEIKVLGTGCRKCQKLEESAKLAAQELNIDAKVEKVEDIYKIMQYGVMTTPALVVNEKVMVKGYVPSMKELKEILAGLNQ